MKLHLGCGKRFLKGYTHVDVGDYKHIDFRHDIRDLSELADKSVELIYASHVLEYFDVNMVVNVLKEWHRVLMRGGILRIAVPDFAALCRAYMIHGNVNNILGPLYGRWEIPEFEIVLQHKTVYDYFSLGDVLKESGFRRIKRWCWRSVFIGENEGFDDYSQSYIPHMDKENGILISLNVEATK